jgi:hypothetical protein
MPELTPDQIRAAVVAFVEAKRAADDWKQKQKDAAQALTDLHRQGLVPSKLTGADGATLSFNRGKTTWEYDPAVKAEIASLQKKAQAEDRATLKTGEPFWTLREPKA